jgi:hypothetical protein
VKGEVGRRAEYSEGIREQSGSAGECRQFRPEIG